MAYRIVTIPTAMTHGPHPEIRIVEELAGGGHRVVAIMSDAIAAENGMELAHRMLDALNGRFSFTLTDWRDEAGELSPEAQLPRSVTIQTSGGGVLMSVKPEGEPSVYELPEDHPAADPKSATGCRHFEVGFEMDSGAFRMMTAHAGHENAATIAVGPHGIYVRSERPGSHGLLIGADDRQPARPCDANDEDKIREEIGAPLPEGGFRAAP